MAATWQQQFAADQLLLSQSADGQLHGEREIYYNYPILQKVETYVRGVLEGPYREYWHSNGKVRVAGAMAGDIFRSGTWEYFDEDGTLWATARYDSQGLPVSITLKPSRSGSFAWLREVSIPRVIEESWTRSGNRWSGKLSHYSFEPMVNSWLKVREFSSYSLSAPIVRWKVFQQGLDEIHYGFEVGVAVWHGFEDEFAYDPYGGGQYLWRRTPWVDDRRHGWEIDFNPDGSKRAERLYEENRLVRTIEYSYGGSSAELLEITTTEYAQGLYGSVMHGNYSYQFLGTNYMDAYTLSGAYNNGVPFGVWMYNGNAYEDYGPPTPLPMLSGPAIPDVPATPQRVRLYGKLTVAGKPLGQARMELADGSLLADSYYSGNYEVYLEPDQTIEVFISHPQTLDYSERVTIGTSQSILKNFRLQPVPPAAVAGVNSVSPDHGYPLGSEFFLTGIPFSSHYAASINWNGSEPGQVMLQINNYSPTNAFSYQGQTYVGFNALSDLATSATGERNRLQVVAFNHDGVPSNVFAWDVNAMQAPAWLGSPRLDWHNRRRAYLGEAKFPETPFSLLVTQNTVYGLLGNTAGTVTWAAWEQVPFIGGEEFGIAPTQADMESFLRLDGTGEIKFSGSTGFKAFGLEADGSLSGGGSMRYVSQQGLLFNRTRLEMKIDGKLSRGANLVDLVPAVKTIALQNRFIDRAVQKVADMAQVEASIEPKFSLRFDVAMNASQQPEIRSASGRLGSAIGISLSSGVTGLSLAVEGKGTAITQYAFPSAYGITGFSVTMDIKVSVHALAYKEDFPTTVNFSFGSTGTSATAAPVSLQPMSMGMRPVATPFAALANYNSVPEPTLLPMGGPISSPTAQSTLVYNVYPYAKPVIASNGTHDAIAYIYYNPDHDILRGLDIAVMMNGGSGWSFPQVIASDTRAEFDPQLAFDTEGRLVAVWQRVKDPAFPLAGTLDDMAAALEIVSAHYDFSAATPTWSEIGRAHV